MRCLTIDGDFTTAHPDNYWLSVRTINNSDPGVWQQSQLGETLAGLALRAYTNQLDECSFPHKI